jgi:pentapeptide MXKDX repeat protein
MGMNIAIVKRPQEDPGMTISRIILSLFAGLVSFSLAGAPAAFAQTKDNMGKTDSMNKDSMSKDSMSKDSMKKDTMSKDTMSKDTMSKDSMKKDDGMSKDNMKK